MTLNLKVLLLCLALLMIMSCQSTGVSIEGSNVAISDSRKAIVAAIGDARQISENGREISSLFHDRQFKYVEVTPKMKRRMYTKVLILGARRPYEINVQVRVEERDPDTTVFQDIGVDEDLSLKRAFTIKQMLNQSREKMQTIDGSNPF